MTTEAVVDATGIEKSYGRTRVLDRVDLTVERGTVLALLGPNGAGKTTMVRILSTLVKADAGQARVAGHDVRRDPERVRASMSLTGQYAAVDELLTGEENLVMMARLCRLGRAAARRRAAELLADFDLGDARGRLTRTYSGGMRRRLDLAVSLIARPPVIFLDEPTTGLDPRSRQQMWTVVRGLADSGVTVLLTTQYLEEADRLADKVTVMDKGRVIAEGTADELKSRVGGERAELTFATRGHLELAAGELAGRAVRIDPPGWRLEVPTDGSADQLRELLDHLDRRDIPVERLTLRRPSLDDVFLTLTGHDAAADRTNLEGVHR